ncbi:hypothetical protein C8F04DRAFT_521519 [Mycena alexandri]|uniref:F-box domain-containing protein n=1 Tax=Mycena alexandri TaxID=1745969 RepID=A0AAD6XH23_9AGAR|nr:hypothetical protein C8F04DRAFT_521519 [Mycena alexandri]
MSLILNHETLPTELWIEIFTHLDERSYAVSHAPFQLLPGIASEANAGTAYTTVVLVCRNWRAWAIGFLYRNIKISDSNNMQAYDRFMDIHREYGQWVQRAILPYSATVTESFQAMPSTEILSLYPNLHTLVRPPHRPLFSSLTFDFDATCPPLFSLRRLDWWNHAEASRSGGINSLIAVLCAAPNLEYLFIGIVRAQFSPFHGLGGTGQIIDLPHLRTLRLSTTTALLLRQIVAQWTLPALDNLVMDTPMLGVGTDVMWESFGPQLRVMELGKHIRFLLEENIASCLRGCPSLHELNYYIFTTMLPEVDAENIYPSITSIAINMAEVALLGELRDEWEHLERHFNIFAGTMFPSLRQLRIYAMSERFLLDERFPALHRQLSDRGCIVEIVEKANA